MPASLFEVKKGELLLGISAGPVIATTRTRTAIVQTDSLLRLFSLETGQVNCRISAFYNDVM